jgi:hypothetical protein
VAPDTAKDCNAFILKVKQSTKNGLALPDPEGRGNMIVLNVSNHSSNDIPSYPSRNELFRSAAVKEQQISGHLNVAKGFLYKD